MLRITQTDINELHSARTILLERGVITVASPVNETLRNLELKLNKIINSRVNKSRQFGKVGRLA